MVTQDPFEQIAQRLQRDGVEAACETLIDQLRAGEQYHHLFDARLMLARHQLGLPLAANPSMDQLSEAVRDRLENAYLEACREVGELLLRQGQLRQAWMYLRPADAAPRMREALQQQDPTDDTVDQWIEVAIYEGVAPARGFDLLLNHHGTCNAITTYDSTMHGRSKEEQQEVAGLLVRWLHGELLQNLAGDGAADAASGAMPVLDWLGKLDQPLGPYTVHIDVSHLGSVVRFARVVTDPETVRLAWDLAEYGSRLDDGLQPGGDPPFANCFPAHRLFFAAQSGQHVDEAVEYFRQQAEAADVRTETTAAVEVYVELLARLGRFQEAIDAYVGWIPESVPTTGLAPSLLELSRRAGDYSQLIHWSRQRDDLLGFAVACLEQDGK